MRIQQARLQLLYGGDLPAALRYAREAESLSSEGGSYQLQLTSLHVRSSLHDELGQRADMLAANHRMIELARAEGDLFSEVNARANHLNAFEAHQIEQGPPGWRAAFLEEARETLALAEQVENPWISSSVRCIVAQYADDLAMMRRCQEETEAAGDRFSIGQTRLRTAMLLAQRGDTSAALASAEEAVRWGRGVGDAVTEANALFITHQLAWTEAPERVDTEHLLQTVEDRRELTRDELVRAQSFSRWTPLYYNIASRLLDRSGGEGEDLEAAFQVAERMRGRLLLERLDLAQATARLLPEGDLAAERDETLDAISGLQQALLEGDASDRADLLEELEHLEAEERRLRDSLFRSWPAYQDARAPRRIALADVQGVLGEGEAMLSFQLATQDVFQVDGYRNRSWLLVITRGDVRAVALPQRVDIARAMDLFLGLFSRRDGSEARPAVTLYESLLAEALGGLPPEIDRLMLVPDGPLHLLPFAALRPAADAPPLATRYQLATAPSAALLVKWRQVDDPGDRPALVLADPSHPALDPEVAAGLRDWGWTEPLGALPSARWEAQAIQQHAGPKTELMVGDAARESELKAMKLGPYGVLHFAAHAVTDPLHPERSAILLAPGDPSEDGLLQVREVVELPLPGKLVVLSACRSAAGMLLEGEGVMGLARGFFQAGAHGVVGSLWPLRDDDAARFFDRFYAHLAEGHSASEALRRAQQDRIADGAPAEAWAGIVLMGDGQLTPLAPRPFPWLPLAGGLLLAAAAAWGARRRHRREG